MAISSRELYLLDSLTTSPDPLGGRLETMDVFIGLSDPLDDAEPGLVLSPGGTWPLEMSASEEKAV